MLENQTQVRLGLTGGAANQLIPPLPPNVVGPTLNESDPSVCVYAQRTCRNVSPSLEFE